MQKMAVQAVAQVAMAAEQAHFMELLVLVRKAVMAVEHGHKHLVSVQAAVAVAIAALV